MSKLLKRGRFRDRNYILPLPIPSQAGRNRKARDRTAPLRISPRYQMLISILTLITLIAAVSQSIEYRRMYKYVDAELSKSPPLARPKLAVILPCKGIDPGFKNNVTKLLRQDYALRPNDLSPNFEFIFAVAQASDPAHDLLKELMAENPQVKTKLVVAGVVPQRAQKVNNQLAALAQVSPDAEIFVFVDSDVCSRSDFLAHLVAPLADTMVGISTGYRFYIPFRGDWPSLLRSMWNRLTAWELVSKRLSYAWGGAMAITRANFERAAIASVWDQAADDDLSMTTAVKHLGLAVRFVPHCLVISNGDAQLSEVIEWTNRQLILTKVYYPALWRKAILRAAVLAFWLISVMSCFAFSVAWHDQGLAKAGIVGLLLWPVEWFFLFQAQSLWRRVLKDTENSGEEQKAIETAYDRTLWQFICALPLAHLLLPWLTLYSILTNRIRWRGVNYLLKSPTETLVV